jgi:hypothetical protein
MTAVDPAPSYEGEDEDEHHKSVYAHFGSAIYFAQCLEHGLVNALVYVDLIPNHPRPVRSAEEWQRSFDGFMDREFENTLGQLIRKLGRVAALPADLASRLENALHVRNWLAHDYFRERATEWLSREGRERMISELEECRKAFIDADRLLDATFKPVREKYGFTDERLQLKYEKYISEERAKNPGGENAPHAVAGG